MTKDNWVIEAISIVVMVVVLLIIGYGVSPHVRALINGVEYDVQKADDTTLYETKKQVEDTCRSLIVSYEADRLYYEQYIGSTEKEERVWAGQAKTRANKAAVQFNEYILKNSFVWDGNVPEDVDMELELIP